VARVSRVTQTSAYGWRPFARTYGLEVRPVPAAYQPVSRTYPRRFRMCDPRQEVGSRSVLPEVLLWNVLSLTTEVGNHQLRGAYGTHADGNPCQTSTDTEYSRFSVAPCQVVN
jgi:hypothetical protein